MALHAARYTPIYLIPGHATWRFMQQDTHQFIWYQDTLHGASCSKIHTNLFDTRTHYMALHAARYTPIYLIPCRTRYMALHAARYTPIYLIPGHATWRFMQQDTHQFIWYHAGHTTWRFMQQDTHQFIWYQDTLHGASCSKIHTNLFDTRTHYMALHAARYTPIYLIPGHTTWRFMQQDTHQFIWYQDTLHGASCSKIHTNLFDTRTRYMALHASKHNSNMWYRGLQCLPCKITNLNSYKLLPNCMV